MPTTARSAANLELPLFQTQSRRRLRPVAMEVQLDLPLTMAPRQRINWAMAKSIMIIPLAAGLGVITPAALQAPMAP